MSIKIKNNNMGMNSPNSVNISICNDGSNEDHIDIRNDDELEIDTKIYSENKKRIKIGIFLKKIKKLFN